MTGGVVVVLGETGSNFAAGMSNGVAYVLDRSGTLERRTNLDMARVCSLEPVDEAQLHGLVREHAARTGSSRASAILREWRPFRAWFRKVSPRAPAAPVTPEPLPLAGAVG
jgi:glutamate synthase domain-containing protein 3